MNFINNDAKLRSFIPNVFSSVEGEVSLFDKMKTHLQFAESWLDIKKVACPHGLATKTLKLVSNTFLTISEKNSTRCKGNNNFLIIRIYL